MSMSTPNLPKNALPSPFQAERDTASVKMTVKFHELVREGALEAFNEQHQNRMKNLRKEIEYLKETEWKYQPTKECFVGSSS